MTECRSEILQYWRPIQMRQMARANFWGPGGHSSAVVNDAREARYEINKWEQKAKNVDTPDH